MPATLWETILIGKICEGNMWESCLQDSWTISNYLKKHFRGEGMQNHQALRSLSDVHEHQYCTLQKSSHCLGCNLEDDGMKEKSGMEDVVAF